MNFGYLTANTLKTMVNSTMAKHYVRDHRGLFICYYYSLINQQVLHQKQASYQVRQRRRMLCRGILNIIRKLSTVVGHT